MEMCNYNSYKMAKELSDKLLKVYSHEQSFNIYVKLFCRNRNIKDENEFKKCILHYIEIINSNEKSLFLYSYFYTKKGIHYLIDFIKYIEDFENDSL